MWPDTGLIDINQTTEWRIKLHKLLLGVWGEIPHQEKYLGPQFFKVAKPSKMAENKEADDELTIPRAALNKMIKELIPSVRVANDSRDLILNCCTEFIHLLSSEANEICNKQNKKTISAEHILAGACLNIAEFDRMLHNVFEELQFHLIVL